MSDSYDSWYIRGAGTQPAGPFTAEQLIQAWRAGRLDANTICWREGMPQWLPLAQVEPFASSMISASPPGQVAASTFQARNARGVESVSAHPTSGLAPQKKLPPVWIALAVGGGLAAICAVAGAIFMASRARELVINAARDGAEGRSTFFQSNQNGLTSLELDGRSNRRQEQAAGASALHGSISATDVEATIQRARELVKEAREEIAAVERENQGNDIARRTAIDAARAESKKKVEKELAKLRGKTVEWRLTVARVSQVGSEDALYVEELPDAAAPGNEAGVYIVFPREFIRGLGGMFTHNSYLKVGEEVSRSLAERLRPGDHIVVKGSARVACGIGASGLHVLDPTFDVVIELINVIVEDADATLSRHFEGNVPPGRTVASPPPEPVERSRPIPPPAYHAPRHSQEAPRSRGNVGRTNAPVAPPHAVAPTVNLAVAPFDAVKAKECQEAWAGRLNVPAEMSDSIGMRLVLIPAGEFMMGSSAEEISLLNASARQDGRKAKSPNSSNEVPQHRVRITRPFYMGAYHVTRGQFQKFVAQSGYRTDAEKDGKGGNGIDLNGHTEQKREYTWRNPGFEQADNHPVLNVSWNDAVAFCRWLSGQESAVYRLPTEAEWEYACRAGTTTRYHNGDEDETLIEVANIADATCKAQFPSFKSTVATSDGYVFTSPVGGFKPNAFGLFDMHGNVCQWCEDWYEREYYSISPVDDPQGPDSGSRRVDRGGSWITVARGCRSANRRGGFPPDSRYDNVGFRVVRAAVVPTEAETAGARRATGTQAGGDGTKRSPSE